MSKRKISKRKKKLIKKKVKSKLSTSRANAVVNRRSSRATRDKSGSKNSKFRQKNHKKKKVRRKLVKRKINKKTILIVFVITLLFSAFNVWLFWGVPLPTKISTIQYPVSTKLYDRNGKVFFEIYTDRRNTPIDLDQIPDSVKKATIAIEDKNFYRHHGISFSGMARAAYKTLFKQKLEGGSTLTQQLVKNSLLTPERTLKRKLREFALTIIVEIIYSKDQILEIYLNQIPYGSTAYGIGAASEMYFGKPAQDLNLAEATLLAGLPAAPTRFSPFGARPELAKERQNAVLRRMVEDGDITQEEMDNALETPLNYAKIELPPSPHFALWVKDMLAQEYGDAVVEQGGLRVTTTLDLDLQEFAQKAVATEVAKLKKNNVGNGAVIVTRPKTGEILAMVGSKDFFADDEDGKVNVVFSNRQPGSSIKPLNYALGIRDKKITASTPLADVPTCINSTGQKAYCPRNYDGQFHGIPQVRFALANSYNIPAVRVLALNGIENFVNFATKLGITTWKDPSNYGLSLTLGGGEVRPIDMAEAFGVFANDGVKQPLYAIQKIEDYKGNVFFEANPEKNEGDKVLDSGVTFIITKILSDNGARSAAFGFNSFLNIKGHPEIAAKTGTTNNRRDNWTIGYSDQAVVVVWVGNNDNTPMSGAVSGLSGASPIWNTVMKETIVKAKEGFYGEYENVKWPIKPDNVIGATVCSDTGNAVSDTDSSGCPTRFEYFLKDKIGAQLQTGMKDLSIDKTNGQIADPKLPPEQTETQNHPFILDPLGTLFCLDCSLPNYSTNIHYPLPL